MKNEKITAWVTKDALTVGIQVFEGEVCHSVNSKMFSYTPSYFQQFAYGNEWHRTPEDAIKRAEEMRAAKIKSLNKQLATLENMTFVIPNAS